MNKSESIAKLAAALVKVSAHLTNPPFDSTNPHFKNKYASLAGTRDHLNGILSQFGLTVSQLVGSGERGPTVETVLLHESGEWMSASLEMPASKQDAQGWGSATTYARRYALMGICGVVGDVDDDGNEASKPAKPIKQGTGAIAPTTGVWDEMDENQQKRLQMIADCVLAEIDLKGAAAAAALLHDETEGMVAEEKIALWTRLDSKTRSAIKKANDERKAA